MKYGNSVINTVRQTLKRSLARWLILSFGLLVLVAAGMAAVSIGAVFITDNTLSEVITRVDTASLSTQIRSESLVLTDMVRRYTAQPAAEPDLRTQIAAQQDKLDELLQQVTASTGVHDEGERIAIGKVRDLLIAFETQSNRVLTTFDKEDRLGTFTAQELEILTENYQGPLHQAIQEFEELEAEQVQAARDQSSRVMQITSTALVAIIFLVLVAVIYLAIQVIRRIVKPLTMLHTGVEAIGQGDLKSPIPIHSMDEIGRLAAALNTMSAELYQYQENLEGLVYARTNQLTSANKKLSQEITEREHIEYALRRSEENFRQIFEANPFPMLISGLNDGNILMANQAMAALLEVPLKQLIGLKTLDFYINKSDRQKILHDLRVNKKVFNRMLDIKTVSNQHRTILMNLVITTVDKDPVALVGTVDITARIQAEKTIQQAKITAEQANSELSLINQISQQFNSTLELSEVLQTILEGMHSLLNITATSLWERNLDSGELICRHAVGPAYKQIIGWRLEPGQGIAGMVAESGQTIIVPDTLADDRHFSEVNQQLGITIRSLLSLPLKAKGEIIGVLNLLDSKPGHFTIDDLRLMRPIAIAAANAIQNARLFDQAQQSRAAAEAANQAKNIFLASMSHELRTPLNGILGYAQILKRDHGLSSEQARGLAVIESSGRHLLTLINDILDLSKIEAGKVDILPAAFPLPAFLDEIVSLLKLRAKGKGLYFLYEVHRLNNNSVKSANVLPAGIYADAKHLRQILINLLSNAIKFTQHGGVTFWVSVSDENKIIKDNISLNAFHLPSPSDSEQTFVNLRFEIKDTGSGIDITDLERIFEPFQRGNHIRNQSGGTGLGLSISKNLVELMGGQLYVESTPGQGSRFWFELTLPLAAEWQEWETNINHKISGIEGQLPTILVVDDEPLNRAVVVGLLEPFGCRLAQADNAEQGLTLAQQLRPDCIITDLVMPGTDGLEFTRQLRRQSEFLKNTVIIASSASVFEADQQQSIDAGADAFLAKPVRANALYALLEHHQVVQWTYANAAPAQSTSPIITGDKLVTPASDILAQLYEDTLLGDVAALREQTETIYHLDTRFQPFAACLQHFVDRFDINGLQAWLENQHPELTRS